MEKVELVMTTEEAQRLRSLLVTEITWKASPNGKAAASIHRALSTLPYIHDLPHQPLKVG
jgi:hypothetical protein